MKGVNNLRVVVGVEGLGKINSVKRAAPTHQTCQGIFDTATNTLLVSTTYTFTGNGNWDVEGNWYNNFIPSTTIAGNATIIID